MLKLIAEFFQGSWFDWLTALVSILTYGSGIPAAFITILLVIIVASYMDWF